MGKTVLITDKDTAIGSALVEKFLSLNHKIITTLPPGKQLPSYAEKAGETILIQTWNKTSPVAARNLLLSGCNAFGSIDEFYLTFSPKRSELPFHDLSLGSIEERADTGFKGPMILAREILQYLRKQGKGMLAFVLHNPETNVRTAVESAAGGAFLEFSRGILEQYQDQDFTVTAFQSENPSEEEFCRYILLSMDERNGKLNGKFFQQGSKQPFFQFARGGPF